ncbi:hypothetical protein ACEPAH_1740 [Sanghuangporus vaninii]
MADTQDKGVNQPIVEQQQQAQQTQPPMYAFQQPSQYTVGYPPLYPYPPPPQDANGHPSDPNAAPGAYMMAFPPPPPGMIYAYPTPQGYAGVPFAAPGMPLPSALARPKRKQVKMACTNCAAACKRCDEGRPCERCCKYGISDTCVNGLRKERKKGLKRGPYKRKSKAAEETSYEGFTPEQGATGFYQPYFYPPPGFVAVGPDGQPVQGDPSGAQQGMQPQYYSLQPYPPFAFPHGTAGGYPILPGQMLPPSTSSGTETDGESTTAGAQPSTTTAASQHGSEGAVDDSQANNRKKRKSGTGASANGREEQATSQVLDLVALSGRRIASFVSFSSASLFPVLGISNRLSTEFSLIYPWPDCPLSSHSTTNFCTW